MKMLTAKEAMELLDVSRTTLQSLAAKGTITKYRHPLNNKMWYREDELRGLLDKFEQVEDA